MNATKVSQKLRARNGIVFAASIAAMILHSGAMTASPPPPDKPANLLRNSDFSKFTHDPALPDYWNMLMPYTLVTNPFAYVYELAATEKPPVPGVRAMRMRGLDGVICRLDSPTGDKHAFSVYMKSDNPRPDKPNAALSLNGKKVEYRIGTQWTRLSCVNNIKSPLRGESDHKQAMIITNSADRKTTFLIAAPQLVRGTEPTPWEPPAQKPDGQIQGNVPEIMPDITCAKIPAAMAAKPVEAFLRGLPKTRLDQVSEGNPEGALAVNVSMALDKNFIYAFFKCAGGAASGIVKSSPEHPGLLGDDLVEVFVTDNASSGSYAMLVADASGKSFSRLNGKAMDCGVKYQTQVEPGNWTAQMAIPLRLFKERKHWKVAFSRIYSLKDKGRVVLSWPLTDCRGATNRFGTLLGMDGEAVKQARITQAYLEDTVFHYRVGNHDATPGDTVAVTATQDGKALFAKTLPAGNGQGSLAIPPAILEEALKGGDLSVMLNNASGEEICALKKPAYLFLSSLARLNPKLSIFPAFDYFTEKDKTASLLIEGDLGKFDALDAQVSDSAGKTVFTERIGPVQGRLHELRLPLEKFPVGKYKIAATAYKDGQPVEHAAAEVLEKLPFQPYMVRVNRKLRCLADADGNFFPIRFLAYQPVYPEAYSLSPDKLADFYAALKKYGFNTLEYSFYREDQAISRKHIQTAWENGLRTLADPLFIKKRELLEGNRLPPEMGKTARSLTGERGLSCLWIFHEPQDGPGVLKMPEFMKKAKSLNPYLPLSGCWTTRGYDDNGEPLGSIDAADYFESDIYTPDIVRFAGEVNRCSQAAMKVRKPFGVILMLCPWFHTHRSPSPEEIQNQVYQSLIAGCRSIDYFGLDRTWSKRVWEKTRECNAQIKDLSEILLDDNMEGIAKDKAGEVNYAVWRRGGDVCVMAASCDPDRPQAFSLELDKLLQSTVEAEGETRFTGRPVKLKDGRLNDTLPPKGSEVYMFRQTQPKGPH